MFHMYNAHLILKREDCMRVKHKKVGIRMMDYRNKPSYSWVTRTNSILLNVDKIFYCVFLFFFTVSMIILF